jgi:hypothetical protein
MPALTQLKQRRIAFGVTMEAVVFPPCLPAFFPYWHYFLRMFAG